MTARANAALVRYARGHLYVDLGGPGNRVETYIEMGQVDDAKAAEGFARDYLTTAQEPSVSNAATAEVRSIDSIPGLSLRVGDRIGGDLLIAPAYGLTSSGGATVTYGAGNGRQLRLDAIDRQIKRAGNGMASELAAPKGGAAGTGQAAPALPDPWSFSGETDGVEGKPSPLWRVPHTFAWSWVEVLAGEAGWARTRIVLIKIPGAPSTARVMTNVYLPAGVDRVVTVVDEVLEPPTKIRCRIHEIGGAKDLTITPVGAFL